LYEGHFRYQRHNHYSWDKKKRKGIKTRNSDAKENFLKKENRIFIKKGVIKWSEIKENQVSIRNVTRMIKKKNSFVKNGRAN
jgi:hypothetical protein